MRNFALLGAVLLSLGAALPAFAEEQHSCGPVTGTWMSKDQAKAKVAAAGYEVRSVKKEGDCYEVYAIKDGKKQQLTMNPVSGELTPATGEEGE
jgi:hypothetical protein